MLFIELLSEMGICVNYICQFQLIERKGVYIRVCKVEFFWLEVFLINVIVWGKFLYFLEQFVKLY